MQPNTWQGVVRRASLKNRRLGLESDLLAHGVPLGVNLRRTQHEHIFSGLSLSSDVAQRSLTVRSGLDFFEPDQGSRPRWAHTAPGGLDTDMAAQPTVVIVVDDNAGFLKAVARLLAHNGIESRTFASAEALLESGSAQPATCLLLDIQLGGISGIELQRRLAASGSKCPIIFMTANDDDATRNEAVDAGCIAYLRKPFARQVLLDAIGKAAAYAA
jgi:CheY-like chemotaxis protein